jgi:uncharacterized cupredoxin-like copper-binding protein
MRRSTLVFALAATAASLAACGDDSPATGTAAATDGHGDGQHHHDDQSPSAAADARSIEVVAGGLRFDPGDIEVDAGEDVAIVLSSTDMIHDFTIDELGFHVAAGGGEQSEAGLTATEPGDYTYYCSVPGHRAAGMEGTLTVR